MDCMDLFCGKVETFPNALPLDLLEQSVRLLTEPKRSRHVFGCRVTAVALAQHWGADPVLAARAALLHDITKALTHEEQLALCRHYGIAVGDAWPEKTLHALTGCVVADEIFKESQEVCDAVRKHTTGAADMSLLDKIIYIADYIEPSRDIEGVETLRELAFTDLDAAVIGGFRMTIKYLERQGSAVSWQTQAALDALMNQAMKIMEEEC